MPQLKVRTKRSRTEAEAEEDVMMESASESELARQNPLACAVGDGVVGVATS